MIDDAFSAIVDLMTSLTGAQAVINVFPAILERHIESTELLPRAAAKERACRGDHLEAAGHRGGRVIRREPGIDMVRESIEADGDSSMLNGVIRKEKLRSNHRRGWMLEGVVHECRKPPRGRNGVVIEENHKLAGRRRDSSVAGCGETARGLVVNDEYAIAVCCKKRGGPVGRAVVDDDKLPSDLVIRLGEERIQALP